MEKIYGYILASAGSVILALCVYIWTRTITEYDKMISSLFKKQDEHETRISTVEGVCSANTCIPKINKKVRSKET